MTLKIGIAGASGRMGLNLLRAVKNDPELELSFGLVRAGTEQDAAEHLQHNGLGALVAQLTPDMDAFVKQSDVIIDFTTPALSLELAEKAKALVCGTTGFSPEHFAQLEALGKSKPIVWAPNMSVGVNALMALVQKAAASLDAAYDIEITEMHHKHKKDAPSGTALGLGRAAAAGRGVNLDDVAEYARDGITGEREKGTIGFTALRGGDVIGDHTVCFAGPGERIELSHKASNRNIYASGAARAAKWLASKPAGFYSMQDVLGL